MLYNKASLLKIIVIVCICILTAIAIFKLIKTFTNSTQIQQTNEFYTLDSFNTIPKDYESDIYHLSQPTVTNINPIMKGNTYDYIPNYDQPYKTPNFAKSEKFRYNTSSSIVPAELNDGLYNIQTKNKVVLASIAFTPVQCNNFLINPKLIPSKDESWKLEKVSKGIYMLKKPNGSECLYASIGNTLKSYILESGCKSKNVCGLESLNNESKLDEESKRTYFEIWKYPEGYVLKSKETGKFICVNKNKAEFSDILTDECLFDITSSI